MLIVSNLSKCIKCFQYAIVFSSPCLLCSKVYHFLVSTDLRFGVRLWSRQLKRPLQHTFIQFLVGLVGFLSLGYIICIRLFTPLVVCVRSYVLRFPFVFRWIFLIYILNCFSFEPTHLLSALVLSVTVSTITKIVFMLMATKIL